MARPIGNQDEVTSRVQVLRSRYDRWRKIMERLDNWRYMDADQLQSEIWPTNAPDNASRWTIVKPDIAATTETVISFTTSKHAKITATPKNTISVPSSDQANQVERLGYAIYHTIDNERDTPLSREVADHCFHRGAMVTKVLRLSPEERGAVTEEIAPPTYDDPELDAGNESMEVVVSEEKFPVLVQPVDPYECAWMTAPDGRLLEFVHEYDDSADNVLATFPDLDGMSEFADITSGDSNGKVKVTDYWTEDEHCILLNSTFYKQPTTHEYPGIPIVVDLAAPRTRRYSDRGQFAREGTPFCANMLDAISKLSMAESWMTAALEETAFPILTLQGIDPDDSPYMKQGQGNVSEFAFEMDMGPTKKVIPLFKSDNGQLERLEYVPLPPVAPALMQFAGGRLRDASLVAFPESILSGAQTADLSGYAYAQMKQAAFSRVAPYQSSLDRHLSRVMEMTNRLLVHDWDRGPDIPLQLVQLVGQQQQAEQTLEVTKEMLASVGKIKVEIQPELPVDLEKEWTMLFQAGAQGYMGARTIMNKMGQVEDPTIEFEDMIAERFAMEDPQARAAILQKWMRRNNYQAPQPQAQPQTAPAAPVMPGAAPGALPPGDPGMAPQLPPEAMAAMAGGAPQAGPPMGGQIPPEAMAALQQQGVI